MMPFGFRFSDPNSDQVSTDDPMSFETVIVDSVTRIINCSSSAKFRESSWNCVGSENGIDFDRKFSVKLRKKLGKIKQPVQQPQPVVHGFSQGDIDDLLPKKKESSGPSRLTSSQPDFSPECTSRDFDKLDFSPPPDMSRTSSGISTTSAGFVDDPTDFSPPEVSRRFSSVESVPRFFDDEPSDFSQSQTVRGLQFFSNPPSQNNDFSDEEEQRVPERKERKNFSPSKAVRDLEIFCNPPSQNNDFSDEEERNVPGKD